MDVTTTFPANWCLVNLPTAVLLSGYEWYTKQPTATGNMLKGMQLHAVVYVVMGFISAHSSSVAQFLFRRDSEFPLLFY